MNDIKLVYVKCERKLLFPMLLLKLAPLSIIPYLYSKSLLI